MMLAASYEHETAVQLQYKTVPAVMQFGIARCFVDLVVWESGCESGSAKNS